MIYRRFRQAGEKYIAIVGDLNDFRIALPIQPLFANTGLKDISDHQLFDNGGYVGTYWRQGVKEKFDYVLLSPDLFSKVTGGRRLSARGLGQEQVRAEVGDLRHADASRGRGFRSRGDLCGRKP